MHLFMCNGGSGVARSGAISGAKRRSSCPGSLQHVAFAPTAAELPVAEARLRTSLEWLDADCGRAVALQASFECKGIPACVWDCPKHA